VRDDQVRALVGDDAFSDLAVYALRGAVRESGVCADVEDREMTLRGKLELAAAIALLGGVVLGGRSWVAEHDLRVRAKETADAVAREAEIAAAQIQDLQKQMAARDAGYQQQLQSLSTKFQQAGSPEQTAQLVSQLLGLKEPIQIVTPAASAQSPNPAPVAELPQIDFQQAKAYVSECEACKVNLAKATADAATREAEMAAAQKQIEALKAESAAWEKAAKGGSWAHRAVSGAKKVAIGVVIGIAAACGSGHCK
jgi:hypothetical protein